MNQDKDLKVEVRRGKEKKVKALFKGMLGWVFWLASPFIRAWHRHRVVLACTPYGWVVYPYNCNKDGGNAVKYIGYTGCRLAKQFYIHNQTGSIFRHNTNVH